MGIKLEDIRKLDYSDVTVKGRRIAPTSPGDILLHDFMEPFGLSANALARALKVPPNRITAILSRRRAVTADTALRLARYFGTTPEFWLNLQTRFDLESAADKLADSIEEITPREGEAA